MDVKGLKEVSCLKWRPDSFVIPVCDPDNAEKVTHVNLMERMIDKPKHNGREHKVSYFTMNRLIDAKFYVFTMFQKDNRVHVDKRMQTGRQLVDFLNEDACRNNGCCLEASQHKLNMDYPFMS